MGAVNLFSTTGYEGGQIKLGKNFQTPDSFVKLKTFFVPRGGLLELEVVNQKNGRNIAISKEIRKKKWWKKM